MPLPNFNHQGELPPGVHEASIDEVYTKFGKETLRRQLVTIRLRRLYDLAKDTGQLERVIIFGSYITSKPNPNDVDVVLIFNDDFDLNSCNQETRILLDHRLAADEFKASVFWVRPAMLFLETLEEFIAHWQIKRDKTLRGIVEVRV